MKRFTHLLVLTLFLTTGVLTQYGCGSKEPVVVEAIDTDGDGLTDDKEIELGLDPTKADTDGDGITDAKEIELGTDPKKADTDNDGLSDGDEVNSYKTDPKNADSDGDGLSDGDEVLKYKTDPMNTDSDGDGLSDEEEVIRSNYDPNSMDSDGDGFTDAQEKEMGTNGIDPSDPYFVTEGALKTINFDFDKSNIRDTDASKLADNVDVLKKASAFKVRVDAYTDHVGGDQYNLRLSLRRAKAVVEFYTSNGIAVDRIESRGLGKAPIPCMDETPEKGCEKNRRAESHPISTLKYKPGM